MDLARHSGHVNKDPDRLQPRTKQLDGPLSSRKGQRILFLLLKSHSERPVKTGKGNGVLAEAYGSTRPEDLCPMSTDSAQGTSTETRALFRAHNDDPEAWFQAPD